MKNIMKYALVAGLMMVFASCDEPKETKQFLDMKAKVADVEEEINTAIDCDNLAMVQYALLGLETEDDEYLEKDIMTKAEAEQIEQMIIRLNEQLTAKSNEFACKEASDRELDLDEMQEEEYFE